MQFTAWTKQQQDPGRRRRLIIAYATSMAVLAGVLAAGVAFGESTRKKEKEEEVDVKFMAKVEEAPKPPPPPPPPPPPAPKVVQKAPVPVEAPALATAQPIEAPPTEVPKARPEEADPAHAKEAVPMDQTGTAKGSIYGVAGGTGTGRGPGTAASGAPAPAVPEKAAPIALPEDADPPEAITKTMPEFPSEARAQGLQAEVIVRYVITESGDVTDVKVLRGDPVFNDVCVEAVKTWKFKPVIYQGHAIAIRRIHKFPFRIRT
jgi:protein TonB